MSSAQSTVEAVRDEIIVAIAELRTVAQSEHDERRANVADWFEDLFADVTDERSLHEAAAEGLGMYRGGMGSFQDVGSAASAQVVGELYVALQRGRTLGAEAVASEPFSAAHRRTAPTIRKPRTVQAALEEIIAAIAELRAAALLGQDEQRAHIADGLDERFANVTNRRGLRKASARSLGLYRGGSGSFRDVGYEAAGNAVDRLYAALRRGRSWFLS